MAAPPNPIIAEPLVAIQKAQFAALTASGGLPRIDGRPLRVFDRVPAGRDAPEPPYVVIGDDDAVDDSADGYDGEYLHTNTHVWSRKGGRLGAKSIAEHAKRTLNVELDASDGGVRVVTHIFERTRILEDPDGVTVHAIVTIKYGVEPI